MHLISNQKNIEFFLPWLGMEKELQHQINISAHVTERDTTNKVNEGENLKPLTGTLQDVYVNIQVNNSCTQTV